MPRGSFLDGFSTGFYYDPSERIYNYTTVAVPFITRADPYNLSSWMFWDGTYKKIIELTWEELECAIAQISRGVDVGGQQPKIISLEKERVKRRANMQLAKIENKDKEKYPNHFMRRIKKGKKNAKKK